MIVKLTDVACGYTNKVLLNNLNLKLQTGEGLCILGPNGIGKTTFFKTLLGQIEPLKGKITYDGKNMCNLSRKEWSMVFAYVPQAKEAIYQHSVFDVILMGRAAHIPTFSMPTDYDMTKVNLVLEKLDFVEYANRRYCELSGGEQQIVLLARAMVQESKYILLDEPASNLDFYNQRKLIGIINELIETGVGVVMVSHMPEHAFMCCEKALIIQPNGIYHYGKAREIVTEKILTDTYGTPIGIQIVNEKLGLAYLK